MGNQSVHLNRKAFEHLFGTELELLKETNLNIIQLEREDIFYGGIKE
jgi:propanediol utilization protein